MILHRKKQDAPFLVELKPSRMVQRMLIVIHFIALAASIVNALPLPLKLGTAALVGLNYRLTLPRFNKEQRKIRHTEKRGWEISAGNDFEAVDLLNSTVVTTFFIFLHLQNKPSILIAKDALSEGDYRQLIVKLKMSVR